MAECSTSEFFTHRRPKLTLLHLFTDLFRKDIFPHSSDICKVITIIQCYYNIIYNVITLGYGHRSSPGDTLIMECGHDEVVC